jgi:hypothetical protein
MSRKSRNGFSGNGWFVCRALLQAAILMVMKVAAHNHDPGHDTGNTNILSRNCLRPNSPVRSEPRRVPTSRPCGFCHSGEVGRGTLCWASCSSWRAAAARASASPRRASSSASNASARFWTRATECYGSDAGHRRQTVQICAFGLALVSPEVNMTSSDSVLRHHCRPAWQTH